MKGIVSIIGCGNIGLPLARLLVKDGFLVKGSTTRKSKLSALRQAGIQPFLINLNEESDRLLADLINADIVVITFPPRYSQKSRKSYEDQLHFISQKLQTAKIEKVIFTSSTGVYPQNNNWVTEEDAAIIASRFTDTPILTLERIFSQHKDFKTTILRFAGLMGPSFNPGLRLAGRELKGANNLINMVHQDDCAEIMYKIIRRDIWGETFNVVADQHPTKRDYFNRICDLQGLARPNYIEGQSAFRIVSNDKLKKTLGYQFLFPDPLAI